MGNIDKYAPKRVTSYTIRLDGHSISLTKLSADCGKTISHLSRIFSGDLNGSIETIRHLAKLLDRSTDNLIDAIKRTKCSRKARLVLNCQRLRDKAEQSRNEYLRLTGETLRAKQE